MKVILAVIRFVAEMQRVHRHWCVADEDRLRLAAAD
jgi:hypothetical protein